eukprot:scaffold29871_cov40-Cyclotella_meneghiniana.AAC.5
MNATDPIPVTSQPTNQAATSTTTTTTSSANGELIVDTSNRCGFTELDARENCKPVCSTDSDCDAGEYCWTLDTSREVLREHPQEDLHQSRRVQ